MFIERHWRRFVPAILAVVGLAIGPNQLIGAERPNFVLIIADDLSPDDTATYGNPACKTPNLDRLAAGGMRFDAGFVTCSSCSPSRASILTGRYPHATGAQQLHWPVPDDQVSVAEELRKSGYWTGQAGKWHLGEAMKSRFDAIREAGGGVKKGAKPAGKADKDASGCAQWLPLLAERPKDKPFFVWLASLDPHRDYEDNIIANPHRPENVVVPPFLPDTPEVRQDLARYYDEIVRLDGHVGAVLDELDRQGVADNTFVLFITDNGRPFPRCKTTLYDSGIRSPWLVRWPKTVKAGSSTTSLVSSVDIAPTILELAGATPPGSFQGRSFASMLTNPKAIIREYIYAEHNWHDFEACERAVRSRRYKYIHNEYPDLAGTPPADAVRSPTFATMRQLRDAGKLTAFQNGVFVKPRAKEELYDLGADPNEEQNLAADPKNSVVLEQMRTSLKEWQAETRDFVPIQRTGDEFDRETGNPIPGAKRPRGPVNADRTY